MSTYDASNRKSIRRAEKAANLAEANRVAFVRASMGSLGGREYIFNLLQSCSIFRTPYVRGDAHATAFNCGQQNIGLIIFADVIQHCPNEYLLMISEQATKEEAHGRRNADDNTDRDTSSDSAGTEPDSGRDDSGSVDDAPINDPRSYVDEHGFIKQRW